MPFGLCNALATFQGMMNEVLREFLDQGVFVYLDNFLIYSKSMKEHVQLVRKILTNSLRTTLQSQEKRVYSISWKQNFWGSLLIDNGCASQRREHSQYDNGLLPKTSQQSGVLYVSPISTGDSFQNSPLSPNPSQT